MEKEFNKVLLKQKLSGLIKWKQLVFHLSICERMYPNFILFSSETDYKGADILSSALRSGWEAVIEQKLPVDLLSEAAKCEEVAPDTEHFSCLSVSAASDAATTIANLMRAISQYDVDYVVDSAGLACDSIDMYVQEIENMNPRDKDLEENIVKHKLMQNELKLQRESIHYLRGIDNDLSLSKPEIQGKWLKTRISSLGFSV